MVNNDCIFHNLPKQRKIEMSIPSISFHSLILLNTLQFTVTKVNDADHKRQHGRASISSRPPSFDTIDEHCEFLRSNGSSITPTDTLTQNSITALLSNKWRVSHVYLITILLCLLMQPTVCSCQF